MLRTLLEAEADAARLDRRSASPDNRRHVSLLRSSGPVCAALLLACTKLNPAFDLDTGEGGLPGDSSDGPATAPTTDGSISATGVGPDTGGTGTSTSTSTGTGTGTGTTQGVSTGPGCGRIGEPCGEMNCCEGCGVCMAGTCKPGADTCGPCDVCNADSQCTPQPPMTPCELADDACSGKLWGLDNGTCFANAPGEGLCDLEGACQPQACAQGDALVVCDIACIIDPGNCEAGMPVAQVDAAVLCAQDGPTPACKTGCVVGGEDAVVQNSCKAGLCTPIAVSKCGKYKCKDEQTCGSTCDNNGDCKVGFCTEAQLCQ